MNMFVLVALRDIHNPLFGLALPDNPFPLAPLFQGGWQTDPMFDGNSPTRRDFLCAGCAYGFVIPTDHNVSSRQAYLGGNGFLGQFSPDFFEPFYLLGAVPEPGTWTMMIAGFGLVGAVIRRRHRALRTPARANG
jgi:hypothetical protein